MSRSGPAHNNPAVVVGLDSMQGLQTARILADRNVPVIGIAKDRRHAACRTNVCERIIYAGTSGEPLAEALVTLGPQLSDKAVLVPCEDENVLTISGVRDRLSAWYHIALPDHDTIDMLTNKIRFHEYAESRGFPVPTTRTVRSREEAQRVAQEMTYPCVVKPPNRTGEWSRNTYIKAFEVADASELLEIYDKYHRWTDSFIVQRWIEGDDSTLYSCNCYLDADGEPLATFVARKLRQWPVRTGQSCLGEECRDDTVLELTLRLFRECGHRGLGYVEIKRDSRKGDYVIVEPNVGRPTGRSAIAEAGGVELLYTMYCDLTGRDLPIGRQQSYGGVKWIHLRRDLQSAVTYWRRGELTLRDWWRSCKGPKAYALWSRRDPKPFFADIWESLRLVLSPRERRKRVHRP